MSGSHLNSQPDLNPRPCFVSLLSTATPGMRCTERRRLHRRDVTMDRAWSGRLERAGCVEQEERHELRAVECEMRTDAMRRRSAPCWLDGAQDGHYAEAGEAEARVIPRGAAVVPTCRVRRVACRRVRRPRRARRRCPRARRPAARGERPSAGRAAAHVGFAAVGARPGCSGSTGPSRAARRPAARGHVLVGPAAGEQLRARARDAAGRSPLQP